MTASNSTRWVPGSYIYSFEIRMEAKQMHGIPELLKLGIVPKLQIGHVVPLGPPKKGKKENGKKEFKICRFKNHTL